MQKYILVIFIILALLSVSLGEDKGLPERYAEFMAEMEEKGKSIKSEAEYYTYLNTYKNGLSSLIKDMDYKKLDSAQYLVYLEISMELGRYEESGEIIEHGEKLFPGIKDDIAFHKAYYLANTEKYSESAMVLEEFKKRDAEFLASRIDKIFEITSVLVSKEMYAEAYGLRDFFLIAPLSGRYPYYISGMLSSLFLSLNKTDEAKVYLEKLKGLYEDEKIKTAIDNEIRQISLIGQEPPLLTLKSSINGDALIEKHRGKVIIIDFWAPWCAPCRKSIPHLIELYDEYREKGLVIIGITQLYGSYNDGRTQKQNISPEDETELIKGFIKEEGISYPNGIVTEKTEIDKYYVMGIPHLVFIDKNFRLRYIKVGYGDKTALVKIIDELIGNQ